MSSYKQVEQEAEATEEQKVGNEQEQSETYLSKAKRIVSEL